MSAPKVNANVLPDWWSFSFMGLQAVRIPALQYCPPLTLPLVTHTSHDRHRLSARLRVSAHTQAALLPLFVQHVSDPLAMFLQVLPNGFDKATDGLKTSLRVEMAGTTNAHCEPACHV